MSERSWEREDQVGDTRGQLLVTPDKFWDHRQQEKLY